MADFEDPSGWDFKGDDRYRLVRRIGEGGMGVVYEVEDTVREERLALKTLLRASPAAIYRFKREFRALADVSHPNLVTLHELVSAEDRLYFTMELVKGQDILRYVRPGEVRRGPDTPTEAVTLERATIGDDEETVAETDPSEPPPLLPERLHDAARQLAEGLVALHDAGKLHRDIKPSNVLVTREGRVVLLDFGLAADLDEDSLARSHMGMVVGTVAYMAPEQAVGKFTKASDWYSVGVVLYQALTGRLPFTGSMFKMVLDKQERMPTPPDALVPNLPPDLVKLTFDLLRTDPRERPIGRDVLRRLGGFLPSRATPALAWATPELGLRFVGREGHLGALSRAFDRAAKDRGTVVVHVHGAAGIGKSALVRQFLDRLGDRAHVLSGRCYEHERVPYKAFDSLVDGLSRHLSRRPPAELQDLLPEHVAALARQFPVLNRVEAIQLRSAQAEVVPDPIELRRRAFGALRTLLTRLAAERPLVLFVDDLMWGDADSARLFEALLAAPPPPRLMLVVAYRAEDRDSSELLRLLRTPSQGAELREVIVGPLDHAASRVLAAQVLAQGSEADEAQGSEQASLRTTLPGLGPPIVARQAEAIARESRGSPLFLLELAAFVRAEPDATDPTGETAPGLDEVLARRFARLDPPTRRLLEILAIAGRPLGRDVANLAAGLPEHDTTHAHLLVTAHLARSRQVGDADELETYHHRIRDALRDSLPARDRQARHAALAEVLLPRPLPPRTDAKDTLRAPPREETPTAALTPEEIAQLGGTARLAQAVHHLEAAGDPDRASAAALDLAQRATRSVALERAAELAQMALDLSTSDHGRFALERTHAEALENAGHKGAGEAYLKAARSAEVRRDALEMRRRAAEQLLRFGYVERGLDVLKDVLRAWGMGLPGDAGRALAELRVHRSRLLARGLEYGEGRRASPEVLAQADACWTAAVGLTMVDTVTASIFITRYLHLALDAGDPARIARGLAMELAYLASAAKQRPTRTQRVLTSLRALAQQVDAPYVRGFAALGAGLAAWHEGAWPQAERACDHAARTLESQCTGVDWELTTSRTFRLWARALEGRFEGLADTLDRLVADADERESRYASTILRLNANSQVIWLAADRPTHARVKLREALQLTRADHYHLERYWTLSAQAQLALYAGRGDAAWDILTQGWRALAEAGVFRVQVIRWEAVYLRARVALAAAAGSSAHRPLLSTARADADRLRNAGPAYAAAWGTLVLAQANRALGLQSEAKEIFESAAQRLDAASMPAHAAVARLRIAQIMGPRHGKPLATEVLGDLKQRGVVRPERMAFLLSPGA